MLLTIIRIKLLIIKLKYFTKLNILINVSNLHVGGGVQVATSFLNELKSIKSSNFFHVVVPDAVKNNIERNFSNKRFKFYFIKNSSSGFVSTLSQNLKLTRLESEIKPKVVFTLFGPSYWRPKSNHIMGFADPWVLNPSSKAYNELSNVGQFKMRLKCWIKGLFIIKDSDICIVETQDAKNKMSHELNINIDSIYVVGNCLNGVFNDSTLLMSNHKEYFKLPRRTKDEFRLILISHLYPHKNIRVIKKLIPLLSNLNIKFFITIAHKDFEKIFGNYSENIINLGPVPLKSCPSIYKQCDALFMPSLLEVYSASYLEAMKMSKPILSSNLSFAKDVCGDAALYFDPLDEKDISNKITKLANDKELVNILTKNGIKRLTELETAKTRAKKYLDIILKVAANEY
jgi:glycosyltransferase involved in cell wall biosynthesis